MKGFAVTAVFCAVLLVSCASVDPAEYVRELPPAPLVVAIDPLELPDVASVPDAEFWLAADESELRELVMQSLVEANAASRVVLRSKLENLDDADVVLSPRLIEPVHFEREGLSDKFWSSVGLWAFTFVGGMAVEETTYRVRMVVDCSFQNPQGEIPIQFTAECSKVDLSYLERNGFWSWTTLASLIMPPALTTNYADGTSEALTRRSAEVVGIAITRFLKERYESEALVREKCKVEIESPINGATVRGESVHLVGEITADGSIEEISAIEVSVNGGPPISLPFENRLDPEDGNNRAALDHTITGLVDDTVNFIRIRVTVGRVFTRTLRIVRNDRGES